MSFPGLDAYRQFMLYIVRPHPIKPGKTNKFPIDPATGRAVDPHDSAAWLSLADARALLASGVGEGLAFVFTEQDPFFFLDIDGAYDGTAWSETATSLCAEFPGCFIEVSHSGTGLHIIGTGAPKPHGTRHNPLGLELYTKLRFVALTGTGASGTAATDTTPALHSLIDRYFTAAPTVAPREWSAEPCAQWAGPTDDAELLRKALTAKQSAASAFAGGVTLRDLYGGSLEGHGGGHSEADAALCSHLAFWTGRDCERIDRMFRESGLMRDKWDRSAGPQGTYGQLTILGAVSMCQNVYHDGRLPVDAPPPEPATEEGFKVGAQVMALSGQLEHFKGCVYLNDRNEVWCPDGFMRDSARFNITFGGFKFTLDTEGKSAKGAWHCFTESELFEYPKVHMSCFRPECPSGSVIEEEGSLMVNTYLPVETPRKKGDAGPFLVLLQKLLPDNRDRQILISYLAACLQYPGVKFQWWPVVQGTKGNGKTAILTAMCNAIGNRNTHLPNPDDMARNGNKFNSWMDRKLFVGLEDGATGDRRAFLEAFKTTITNPRLQFEGKGSNQVMGDNRANGMICVNAKDSIPADPDERRYAVFFTAQQSKQDLGRDGMTGDFFPNLWNWLKADGFAIVNDYLRSYSIAEEFNPATGQTAPLTSSTGESLVAAKGPVEQAIEECVAEGRVGFCGGWISSFALDMLLEERRAGSQINHRKRTEILEALGYAPHPGLPDGRANNAFTDPGSGKKGKPRLFFSGAAGSAMGAVAVEQYCSAQGGQSEGEAIFGGGA